MTLAALLALTGCAPPHRELELVPALPACLPPGMRVNSVRVEAEGDFAPSAALGAAASSLAGARLDLPRATRVLAVTGLGPDGVAAFGRTAPLDLDALDRAGVRRLGVAYGPPDGLCAAGALHFARAGHRATRLASGAVVISGGVSSDGFAVAPLEIYLPAGDAADPSARFTVIDGALLDARAALGHAAAQLPDGGFVITGGAPAATRALAVADGIAFQGGSRYGSDGRARGDAFVLGGGPRAYHSATALADGRVLLTGGCAELDLGRCRAGAVLGSSLVYDPASGRFSDGPALAHPRWDHDAVVLGDGGVLLVGGHGDGGDVPAERLDLGAARGGDVAPAGQLGGRAAGLPSGAVLVAGGGTFAPAAGATLWLSADEAPLDVGALDPARAAATVTALDDGGALVAGGGDGPLYLYDGRGGLHALGARFAGSQHSATRLGDGTVLLAGGLDGAGAVTTAAWRYFRSPLGPWSSLGSIGFDTPDAAVTMRRPDRALIGGGVLTLATPPGSDDGRPREAALVAGLEVVDFTFDVLAGRRGPGAGALVFAWRSDGDYDAVTLQPGQPVQALAVRGGAVASIAECRGAALADAELPDGALSAFTLSFRSGIVSLSARDRTILHCHPHEAPARGALGIAVLSTLVPASVVYDNLTVTR